MYDHATIDALKTSLRGALLQPDDAGYEMARKVYNGMIDWRPRFIVRCSNVADVIAAVKFAGKRQLLVAVRGGAIQLGQAQVPAVEVDNLAELVGGTRDSDLYGGKAIGPDSI